MNPKVVIDTLFKLYVAQGCPDFRGGGPEAKAALASAIAWTLSHPDLLEGLHGTVDTALVAVRLGIECPSDCTPQACSEATRLVQERLG